MEQLGMWPGVGVMRFMRASSGLPMNKSIFGTCSTLPQMFVISTSDALSSHDTFGALSSLTPGFALPHPPPIL